VLKYRNVSLDINAAFTIRVWGGKDHKLRLMCEWVLDLSGLLFLGEQIQKDGIKYKPNSLLFGMFDVYFGAPMEEETLVEEDVSMGWLPRKTRRKSLGLVLSL
jgi:hypothetical protein